MVDAVTRGSGGCPWTGDVSRSSLRREICQKWAARNACAGCQSLATSTNHDRVVALLACAKASPSAGGQAWIRALEIHHIAPSDPWWCAGILVLPMHLFTKALLEVSTLPEGLAQASVLSWESSRLGCPWLVIRAKRA